MHADVYTDCSINDKRTIGAIAIRIITDEFTERLTVVKKEVKGCCELEAIAMALTYISQKRKCINSVRLHTDCRNFIEWTKGRANFSKKMDRKHISIITQKMMHNINYLDFVWMKGHVNIESIPKEKRHTISKHRLEFVKVDRLSRDVMRKANKAINEAHDKIFGYNTDLQEVK